MMNSQEGMVNGKQMFPADVIERTTSPYNVVGETRGGFYPEQHFELYGLGWFMVDYHGKKVVSHDGGANGFVTATSFLPEMDLGIVVLTNTDANWFYEAMKMQIIEAYLDMPYRNISETYYSYFHQRELSQEEEIQALYAQAHSGGAAPALPLIAYAGNYRSSVYGDMRIEVQGGGLRVYFSHHPDLFGDLESMGGNKFLCTYNNSIYGVKEVTFDTDDSGVTAYHMTVANFIDMMEYTFERIRR
jgi:hypothetical protein